MGIIVYDGAMLSQKSHYALRALLVLATIIVFTAVAPQAFSAGKRGAAAKAKNADPFETSETAPAKKLAPYIEHLDHILALRRAPGFDRVPGKLAVLKQSFTARQSTAEGAEKTALAAAVVTCDRLWLRPWMNARKRWPKSRHPPP